MGRTVGRVKGTVKHQAVTWTDASVLLKRSMVARVDDRDDPSFPGS